MSKIRFGIVVFPGTNCDRDSHWVAEQVVQQEARFIWHTDSDISDCDVIVVPGGFSYGDYLRAGAIARFSPVLQAVRSHAAQGRPVLGICNGWQVLAETGLIRGAFLRNKNVHFLCQPQTIRTVHTASMFTSLYQPAEVLRIPIAHAEGNFFLNSDDLKYTLDNELIAFQYCDSQGEVSDSTNPNGSTLSIAGVFNQQKNVLGMMPHPERASEKDLGSDDGRRVFLSLVEHLG